MPCPGAGVHCSQLWILKGAPRCFYEAQKTGMVRPKPRREISVILDSYRYYMFGALSYIYLTSATGTDHS